MTVLSNTLFPIGPAITRRPDARRTWRAPHAILLRSFWCLLGLFLWPQHAVGLVQVPVFSASVVVPSQAAEERARALPEALSIVLDRVVGSRAWRNQIEAAAVRSVAERFLEQFSYQELSGQASGATDERFLLTARFSEPAVTRWAADKGLPVWSSRRPEIALWLVSGQDGPSGIATADAGGAAVQSIEQAAAAWSLPLRLPASTLLNRQGVRPGDVRGFFGESIWPASRAMGAELQILARSLSVSGAGGIEWRIHDGIRELESGRTAGAEGDALWTQFVTDLAAVLARRYAYTTQGTVEDSLQIAVDGLRDYGRYAQCLDLLSGMSQVRHVAPVFLQGSRVEFQLALASSVPQFENALALRSALRAKLGSAQSRDERGDIRAYTWVSADD